MEKWKSLEKIPKPSGFESSEITQSWITTFYYIYFSALTISIYPQLFVLNLPVAEYQIGDARLRYNFHFPIVLIIMLNR